MDITIPGLSPFQVMLCDRIWQCDTRDQVQAFRNSLPTAQQQTICDSMIMLLSCAVIDQHIETEADCDQARELIASICGSQRL